MINTSQISLKFALIVGLHLIVSGCASKVQLLSGALQVSPVCCDSYSEIEYSAVSKGQSSSFTIDEKSPAFEFSGGKSYFVAIEIGEGAEALEITSYLVGGWIPTAHMFWPNIIFLDRNHAPTRTLANISMTRGLSWHPIRGGPIWSTTIPLRRAERFAVIYTNPNVIGRQIVAKGPTQGFVVPSGAGVTFVPGSGEKYSTVGAGGYVEVGLQ